MGTAIDPTHRPPPPAIEHLAEIDIGRAIDLLISPRSTADRSMGRNLEPALPHQERRHV